MIRRGFISNAMVIMFAGFLVQAGETPARAQNINTIAFTAPQNHDTINAWYPFNLSGTATSIIMNLLGPGPVSYVVVKELAFDPISFSLDTNQQTEVSISSSNNQTFYWTSSMYVTPTYYGTNIQYSLVASAIDQNGVSIANALIDFTLTDNM